MAKVKKISGRKLKVVVGLSGGVDSALAAALLIDRGFKVTGVHLECWSEPGCRAPEDRKDALAVAMNLGIPFEVLDFRKEFEAKVLDYFYEEYKSGRTPNPDIMCNQEIKFGLFYDWALQKGFDFVATGHYARIVNFGTCLSKRIHTQLKLLMGVDKSKDQTYFLYRLRQEQLARILFPIGDLTKKKVRREAKKMGLPVWDKPDSQGICFIGEVKVREFLKRKIKEKIGDVLDNEGNVVGKHKGVWFYTIGQRHGFSIKLPKKLKESQWKYGLPAFYVAGKDVARNILIVGTEKEVEKDKFEVSDLHFISKDSKSKIQDSRSFQVRIRHQGELVPARLMPVKKNQFINKSIYQYINRLKKTGRDNPLNLLEVKLEKPVKGIAPGQSAVFYSGEECLGGGIIQ